MAFVTLGFTGCTGFTRTGYILSRPAAFHRNRDRQFKFNVQIVLLCAVLWPLFSNLAVSTGKVDHGLRGGRNLQVNQSMNSCYMVGGSTVLLSAKIMCLDTAISLQPVLGKVLSVVVCL